MINEFGDIYIFANNLGNSAMPTISHDENHKAKIKNMIFTSNLELFKAMFNANRKGTLDFIRNKMLENVKC